MIKIELSEVTNSWTNGDISNVHYLNILNMFAGRSHNDLSQYPVFPWVIHNYDGDFDLKNQEMFRDLTKPIGAINKHRLRKLKDFYELQVKDKTLNTPPHLYPTHYSAPGYVSYFLIRKIPEFIVRIQNGVFSPSDRIFRSVESAYYSTMNSIADFKELIPEFYSTECDFLVNS